MTASEKEFQNEFQKNKDDVSLPGSVVVGVERDRVKMMVRCVHWMVKQILGRYNTVIHTIGPHVLIQNHFYK